MYGVIPFRVGQPVPVADNHLIYNVDILLGNIVEAVGDNVRRLRVRQVQLIAHYPVGRQFIKCSILIRNTGSFRVMRQFSFYH